MPDDAKLTPLFRGVNTPKDPGTPTDLEKKHIPVITAPAVVKPDTCFAVEVEVGKLLTHPNVPGHAIQFIELYVGHSYIARLDLTAVRSTPRLSVSVKLEEDLGPLRAFARCNLHGVWESTHPIAIET